MKAPRWNPVAKSVKRGENARTERGKMNERGVRDKGEKEESSSLQPLPVASSVRLVGGGQMCGGETRCFIAIRTIKYITYDFTIALLHREHRRTPVLLPGCLGSSARLRND